MFFYHRHDKTIYGPEVTSRPTPAGIDRGEVFFDQPTPKTWEAVGNAVDEQPPPKPLNRHYWVQW